MTGVQTCALPIYGGHEYEYASDDINMWLRFVTDKGIIALHDTSGRFMYGNCMGVRRAVREHMFSRECLCDYGFVTSIAFATKVHSMSQDEYWQSRKAFLCWWMGETQLYKKNSGNIKLILKLVQRYIKRIPKFIRKPWQSNV